MEITIMIPEDELLHCRQKLQAMKLAPPVAKVVSRISVDIRVDDAPIRAALAELLEAVGKAPIPEGVVRVLLDVPEQLLQLSTDQKAGGDVVVTIGPGRGLAALLRTLRGETASATAEPSAEITASDLLNWLDLVRKVIDPTVGDLSLQESLSIGVDPWKYGEKGHEEVRARLAAALRELGNQFQQCRVELSLCQLAASHQLGNHKGE